MNNPFIEQRTLAVQLPDISDTKGREVFRSSLSTIVDSTAATFAYMTCDEKRLGNVADQQYAAYTYLALAFRMIQDKTISVNVDRENNAVATIFHFAGHAFREIGQLNRAADAYWRAGVLSGRNESPDTFGVRSLTRAKTCYAEIGDTENSDRMHVLEWEARRLRTERPAPILHIWRLTSRYGTSFSSWLSSVTLFILVFAATYEVLHAVDWIHTDHSWYFFLTAVYFCLVTTATVGFGEIVPTHWASQVVVALNIVLAFVLTATGATILGRKVLGR